MQIFFISRKISSQFILYYVDRCPAHNTRIFNRLPTLSMMFSEQFGAIKALVEYVLGILVCSFVFPGS